MTLIKQIQDFLLNSARESSSCGSFKDIVSTAEGEQITYRFSYATGMAWRHKKSSYVTLFGEPPKWVQLLHPSHRIRICDLSIVAGQPLPEAVEGDVIDIYLSGRNTLGEGQVVAKALDMNSAKLSALSMKEINNEDQVTVFNVDSSGTLTMANFREPKIRSEFYEYVYEFWSESPAHLAEAMLDCQPLAWAVYDLYREARYEIQSDLNGIDHNSRVFKKRAESLTARLKAMPEEPAEGVEDWLLTLLDSEFEERVVPEIEQWFKSSPNWNWEDDHLPRGRTAQGAALEFFQNMDGDALDSIGVTIVEGGRPGGTYYAAELKGDVDRANKTAALAEIQVRFKPFK